ncbi:flagellar hook capping protein [Desulfofarcimen acetoxidans DSM 771]|uniref:Flagellar hook capping protein n=1 Tax=Desulfofarcimen acetoxidans (strain ATCC 49208 / DSM 771 / KCTC 5769 / VKM B-1644 / 5575) TaxID=485916 RepID=C8W1G3_DESAS|nr:flagellar hook capping FlgD N-terminal domain-containing protein [Desulfofarcimen acetoxidans]ACV61608.1 flagellar hook capping protein [Desulfofarcimen acetoxidans DSM 771]
MINSTSGVNGSASTAGSTNASGMVLDKEAFLKLFIEQLKNQDPLSPQDPNAFMNQMAQFSVMEQLMNLNTSITQLIDLQNLTEAASLVGRTVMVTGADGTEISGTVEKVQIRQNANKIVIDGESYDISQIAQIG